MSQQAPWTSGTLVGAACTVSIREHMVVPPISELPVENFCLRLLDQSSSRESVRPRSGLVLSHIQGGGSDGRFNC